MTRGLEIDCNVLVEIVTDFLEGGLDADTRRRFVEHLERCGGCDAYVEQMRQTVSLTGSLRAEDVTSDLRERLLAAFRQWHADTSPSPGPATAT